MTDYKAKFRIGQIVHHKLFDYTGVIFDIDPIFQGSEEWYEQVAQSRPPKNTDNNQLAFVQLFDDKKLVIKLFF